MNERDFRTHVERYYYNIATGLASKNAVREHRRTDDLTVDAAARLQARLYPRAAMDDVARTTTDAMMRDAAATMGEDNLDVKLWCECRDRTTTILNGQKV